jgi:hypothetical protein
MPTQMKTLDPTIESFDGGMLERRKLSVAAAAIAATGASDVFYAGDRGTLRLTQTTSAVSGTSPTLDVAVKTCQTPDGTFVTAGSLTQITGAGSEFKAFAVGRYVRLDWTLGGSSTPTVTAGFEGELV